MASEGQRKREGQRERERYSEERMRERCLPAIRYCRAHVANDCRCAWIRAAGRLRLYTAYTKGVFAAGFVFQPRRDSSWREQQDK